MIKRAMTALKTGAAPARGHSARLPSALTHLQAIGFALRGDDLPLQELAEAFNSRTLPQVLGLAQILAEEQPLTVRGVFYRGVSAGLFPNTDDKHYTACGRLILELRRKGFVPYGWIVDSTRRRLKYNSWSGLEDYAAATARLYRKNLWQQQSEYLEVFVEKDAMAGVVEPITQDYDVHLNVIRGNVSETFVYRIAEIWRRIRKPIVGYYLGDHDPNGLKIEEDLRRRLARFSEREFRWQRLGVTPEDFANPKLLGFPVKKNGAKAYFEPYLHRHGDRCVEVDAIPASEIRERVEQAILTHIEPHAWNTLKLIEEEERNDLIARLRSPATKGGAEA